MPVWENVYVFEDKNVGSVTSYAVEGLDEDLDYYYYVKAIPKVENAQKKRVKTMTEEEVAEQVKKPRPQQATNGQARQPRPQQNRNNGQINR